MTAVRSSIALTADRPVGEVTRDVLDAVRRLGGAIEIEPTPQEVAWTVPLDQDEQHARYDPGQVASYFAAATQAALVLAAFRAPYRGRSTPVNAWWGSFDLATNLFSGDPADPPSTDFIMRNAMTAQEIAVGWWPGDTRYGKAAFYAYVYPAPEGFGPRPCRPRRHGGSPPSASSCWTGTTSAAPTIRTARPSNSPGRCSGRPARPARGTRSWPRAARGPLPRSPEHRTARWPAARRPDRRCAAAATPPGRSVVAAVNAPPQEHRQRHDDRPDARPELQDLVAVRGVDDDLDEAHR